MGDTRERGLLRAPRRARAPESKPRAHARTSLLAFVLAPCWALSGCAKPEPSPDGKPVAISPMSRDSDTSREPDIKSAAKPVVKGPALAIADFEKGKHDGTYLQDRCADGLRGTTEIQGTRVSLRLELFDDSKCKVPIETTLSVWRLGTVEGNSADFTPLKETRILWLEAEVASANDKENPRCAPGWAKEVERDISALGECKLDKSFHTLLSIDGDKLRWGSPGQEPGSGEVLDGSTSGRRHRTLEEFPYTREAAGKGTPASSPQGSPGDTTAQSPSTPSQTVPGSGTTGATGSPPGSTGSTGR